MSKLANGLQTRFTKKAHKEIDRVWKKSKEFCLCWAIGPETEVDYKGHTYVVNMEAQTCACRSWQMNGIPCIPASKVILGLGRKLYEYVVDCYTTTRWRKTYSIGVMPLNGIRECPQTNILGVIPPLNRTGNSGRPRNHDRMKSKHETGSKTKLSCANIRITCSNCKNEGHNKTTCSNETIEIPPKKPRGKPRKNQGLHFDESQFTFSQVAPWEVPQFLKGNPYKVSPHKLKPHNLNPHIPQDGTKPLKTKLYKTKPLKHADGVDGSKKFLCCLVLWN